MQHASHGQFYGLLGILVVDSKLVEGSFSTDYHNNLRAKLEQEELAVTHDAISPLHSQNAIMQAKREFTNVQQNDPKLTKLLRDLCDFEFCSRPIQKRITSNGGEFSFCCPFSIH